MYQCALFRLKSTYSNRDCIVMSFLQRLITFGQSSTDDTNSITNNATLVSPLVDTLKQSNFLHDFHSTVKLTSVLSNLPADVRLDWQRPMLPQKIRDSSLRSYAPWHQNFATACRDILFLSVTLIKTGASHQQLR